MLSAVSSAQQGAAREVRGSATGPVPKDSVQANGMLNKNLRKLLLSTQFYRVLPKEN